MQKSAAPLRIIQLCFRWLISPNTINIQSQPSISCVWLCVSVCTWARVDRARPAQNEHTCVCSPQQRGSCVCAAACTCRSLQHCTAQEWFQHVQPSYSSFEETGQNQTVPHNDWLYRKLLLPSPKAAPDSGLVRKQSAQPMSFITPLRRPQRPHCGTKGPLKGRRPHSPVPAQRARFTQCFQSQAHYIDPSLKQLQQRQKALITSVQGQRAAQPPRVISRGKQDLLVLPAPTPHYHTLRTSILSPQ